MNSNQDLGDVAHTRDTGYMSKEAYYEACYFLVEHHHNNNVNGMRFRFQGEV